MAGEARDVLSLVYNAKKVRVFIPELYSPRQGHAVRDEADEINDAERLGFPDYAEVTMYRIRRIFASVVT